MKKIAFIFLLGCVLVTGCVPTPPQVPMPLPENPTSILILPPINNTTSSEAKEYYATTIEELLCNRGYYVFPYRVTTDVLATKGVYYTERLNLNDLKNFKEFFGADAVLITTIRQWDKVYAIFDAALTISLEMEIKSATTNQTLFADTKIVTINLGAQNSGSGLGGLIAGMIITAINTASADYWVYARQATYQSFATIPPGPYWRAHQDALTVQKAKKAATASPSNPPKRKKQVTAYSRKKCFLAMAF